MKKGPYYTTPEEQPKVPHVFVPKEELERGLEGMSLNTLQQSVKKLVDEWLLIENPDKESGGISLNKLHKIMAKLKKRRGL